jgi:hypothetical protein
MSKISMIWLFLRRNLWKSRISRVILTMASLLERISKTSTVKSTLMKPTIPPSSSNCFKNISHGPNSPPNSPPNRQPQNPPNVSPANVPSLPNLHSMVSHPHLPFLSSPQKTFSHSSTPSPTSFSQNSQQHSLPITFSSSSTFFCCFCYRYLSPWYPAASLYCKSSCSTLSISSNL